MCVRGTKTLSLRIVWACVVPQNEYLTFIYVNKLISNTKAKYFQDVISKSKSNPKEMWRNINQLIGKTSKTTKIISVKTNDVILTNKLDISETFNNYFSNIGKELSSQIPHSNKGFEEYIEPKNVVFEFKPLSTNDVTTALNKLKVSKSSGPDKMSTKILKDANEVCVPYLTYIFNCSLNSGIFPDEWKIARVSPIYKSGDKEMCGNYRPISVLSVTAKLFEKLVCDQLNCYLRENQILTNSQSGFREGHSTTTSLL